MYVLVQSTSVKSAENANLRECDAPYHCFRQPDRDRVSLQLKRDEPIRDLIKLLIPPELGMRLARVGAELAARSRVSEELRED